MAESTLTAKGQTTVPAQVREALGFAPGTRLLGHVLPDGSILVRAKTRSLQELAGLLKRPKTRRVPIEHMNAWRR